MADYLYAPIKKNAWINKVSPTTSGGGQTLYVNRGRGNPQRFLLDFDLSVLPRDVTVLGVYVFVYVTEIRGSDNLMRMNLAAASWAETVTWNTQPAMGSLISSASSGSTNTTGFYEFQFIDPTHVQNAIKSSGATAFNGYIFSMDTESLNDDGGYGVASKLVSGKEPALQIRYAYKPTVTKKTLNGASAAAAQPVDIENVLLAFDYNDQTVNTLGQSGYYIRVFDSTNKIIFDSGYVSGQENSYKVATKYFQPGGKYRWEVKGLSADYVESDWNASGGWFMVNTAPTTSVISPSGGSQTTAEVISTLTPSLKWSYGDPDAGAQAAYYVTIFNEQGQEIHNSGWVSSAAITYQPKAGVLQWGKAYMWAIKARDQYGRESDQSDPKTAWFYTNQAPSATLVYNGTKEIPSQLFEFFNPWLRFRFSDAPGESMAAAQIRIYDENGTLIHDSGITTQFEEDGYDFVYRYPDQATPLQYLKKYQYEVRVQDNFLLWSSYTSRGWFVWSIPAPTSLSAVANEYKAQILLDWGGETSKGHQGYNVYRSTSMSGPWDRINFNLITASEFVDTTAISGVQYWYCVESFATASQTSGKSEPVTAKITFSAWFLGSFKFDGALGIKHKKSRNRSMKQTLKQRIIQDGGYNPADSSLDILLSDDEENTGQEKFNALMAELSKPEVLSLRDPFGNQWSVTAGDVSWEPLVGTGKLQYKISIELSEAQEGKSSIPPKPKYLL